MADNVIYLPGCDPQPELEPVTLRIVIEPQPQSSGWLSFVICFAVGFVVITVLLS